MKRAHLIWLASLGLAASIACEARADSAAEAREILNSGRYQFCTDSRTRLSESEHAYCESLGDSSVCPGLAKACKLAPKSDDLDLSHLPSGDAKGEDAEGKDGKAKDEKTRDDGERQKEERSRSVSIPSLGGLGQALFIGLAVVFLALLARFIWKNVERNKTDDEEREREPEQQAEAAPARREPDPVETDVQRLLARALKRAETDPKRAMEDAYAALLRRLEGDGVIHLHPSRTNGDYLRAVRERGDLKRAMAGIVRDLERVQFGSDAPTPAGFRSIYERVLPWVGRAMLLALVVLGVSTSLSCSSVPQSVNGGSTKPLGTRAIAELIASSGRKVEYHRVNERPSSEAKISVVLADARLDEAEKRAMVDRVREVGGVVIFVGNAPGSLGLESTGATATGRLTENGSTASLAAPPTPYFTEVPRGAITLLERTPSGPLRGPVRNVPYAVRWRVGEGEIIAFADDALFRNIAMASPVNADFMGWLFRRFDAGNVELYDSWATRGASSPLASVDNAHLTPILLQLLAVAVLLFIYKGAQFGAPRDARGRSRRAFVEHARAIGAAFQRAKASDHALGLFGVWAFDRLRSRGERGNQRGTRHLAHVISARTGEPEAEVLATLRDARELRDEAAPPSSREAPPSSKTPSLFPPSDRRAPPIATMAKLDTYLRALSSSDRGPRRT